MNTTEQADRIIAAATDKLLVTEVAELFAQQRDASIAADMVEEHPPLDWQDLDGLTIEQDLAAAVGRARELFQADEAEDKYEYEDESGLTVTVHCSFRDPASPVSYRVDGHGIPDEDAREWHFTPFQAADLHRFGDPAEYVSDWIDSQGG